MKKRDFHIALIAIVYVFLFSITSTAEEKEKEEAKNEFDIPSHVLTISKENTFPNSSEDQAVIEPSELTKSLIEDLNIPIENPDLIKMLNETTLKPSPLAIGYRGNIYLGRWPLNYKSSETTVNWEYQKINENEINNIGGEQPQELFYNQQGKKEVKGALTNKIMNPNDIKKMMLLIAKEKTDLPLAFHTVIGENTKKDNTYTVPAKKQATLHAYAPSNDWRSIYQIKRIK